VALVISSAALQLDGNETDSFTVKGGLYKGGCTKPPPEPTYGREGVKCD
jgi:hypothetical protein